MEAELPAAAAIANAAIMPEIWNCLPAAAAAKILIVLAIGAYVSGVLGLPHAIALGLMTALMIGVLKGSSMVSVIAAGGLCVALTPLGVKVLLEEPMPRSRAILCWSFLIIGLLVILFFLGQAG